MADYKERTIRCQPQLNDTAALKAKNIGTSVHFIPLHMNPYYRDKYGYKPEDFPQVAYVYEKAISLPLYSKMTEKDIDDVLCAVRMVAKDYSMWLIADVKIPRTSLIYEECYR